VLKAVDRALAGWHLRRRDAGDDATRRPDRSVPAGTEGLPQIRHIVLLMMENHSFDNYLGTLGHGDGLPVGPDGSPMSTNPRTDGSEVRAHRLASTTQHVGVPSQSWNASHSQFDGGANDGFARSAEQTVPGADPALGMGYWTEEDLPFYAGLSRTFALADRWFSSCMGPTFPNRRFLVAATANGLIDDQPLSMVDYPRTGTIFDLLDRHGISWVNYHHVTSWRVLSKRLVGGGGLRAVRRVGLRLGQARPTLLEAVRGNIQFTADLYPVGIWRCLRHLRSVDRFWVDAAAGALPAVSVVDPDFQACSEENPQDIQLGEQFAAKVIKAVMDGQGWPHTLLIWFYDEHGGYYDHMAPPPAVEPDDVLPRSLAQARGPLRWLLEKTGKLAQLQAVDSDAGRYDRLGFRVPAVVVSPYARPAYVCSTLFDHTSALKLIERKWNLPPLTRRDAAAADPLEMVDLDRPPAFLQPPDLPAPALIARRSPKDVS